MIIYLHTLSDTANSVNTFLTSRNTYAYHRDWFRGWMGWLATYCKFYSFMIFYQNCLQTQSQEWNFSKFSWRHAPDPLARGCQVWYTHRHIHAHARTHARTHTHTHTEPQTETHIHTHTHSHTDTHYAS